LNKMIVLKEIFKIVDHAALKKEAEVVPEE
jgi:hypothetical protein